VSSLAERWTYPSAWPQRVGLRYWRRLASGDLLEPLQLGLVIAVIVTLPALALAIPLGYALTRLAFPGRTVVLLLFLLPQAFPQLPVFAGATREFYRFGLAGTIPGVVLVHLVGGLVFAAWTMTAVFRSIAPELEEAAWNLGASPTRAFVGVSLPLALPGIVIASVTAIVLMAPGAVLLLLERLLKSEDLVFFGQLQAVVVLPRGTAQGPSRTKPRRRSSSRISRALSAAGRPTVSSVSSAASGAS
jgi:ABC-type spermidine/putrescine transport system permease subunit II